MDKLYAIKLPNLYKIYEQNLIMCFSIIYSTYCDIDSLELPWKSIFFDSSHS